MEEEDDPVNRSSLIRWSRLAVPIAIVGLIAGACSSGGATTAPTTAPTSAPASAPASAAAGTVHVSIVNKDMTPDEVKAEIAKEGSLTVGNWTYAATDELVKQFQQYVKDTYGQDIKLNYVGTQAPSEYLTKMAAAKQAGNPAPYDVIAVEENYWYDADQAGLVDAAFPSDLIPDRKSVV